MHFLIFVLLVAIVWLLWNISKNTGDALDKQTAIQYELISLHKKLDAISESAAPQAKLSESGDVEVKKASASASNNVGAGQRVNINHASVKDLSHLPRIGKALAQRIIDTRPYSSVDELISVQGISKELLDEIKTLINVK